MSGDARPPARKRSTTEPDTSGKISRALAGIAAESGATLHAYPRPGRAVRRVVLRDTRDDRGAQFEAAQIEDDDTLRVTGHDTGPRVSEFFGAAITSYEWVYVVGPGRMGELARLLGTAAGGDVLGALAAYYRQHDGQISDLLRSPEIGAEFDNWHS